MSHYYKILINNNDKIVRKLANDNEMLFNDLTSAKIMALKLHKRIPFDEKIYIDYGYYTVHNIPSLILETGRISNINHRIFRTVKAECGIGHSSYNFKPMNFTNAEYHILRYNLNNNYDTIHSEHLYNAFIPSYMLPPQTISELNWNRSQDRKFVRDCIENGSFFKDRKHKVGDKNKELEYYSAAIRLENQFCEKMNDLWE